MYTVWSIALKDLKLLARDKTAFFFTFAFPVLYAVIFGFFFSGSSNSKIKMVIVDQDNTNASALFIKSLEKTGQVTIKLSNESKAKQLVLKGKQALYLKLPKGFGTFQKLAILGHPPQIEMGIDPSKKVTGAMMKGLIMQTSMAIMAKSMENPEKSSKDIFKAINSLIKSQQVSIKKSETLIRNGRALSKLSSIIPKDFHLFNIAPIVIKPAEISSDKGRIKNAFNISFPQGILWGILSCLATFAVSLVAEKSRGTLGRLNTAPISKLGIISGKALASFITNLLIIFTLMTLGMVAFKISPISMPLFIFSAISVAFGFTGIMVFISVLAKSERSAESMAWAIMMILAMSGGAMIPLFVMPKWMLTISNFSPVKWGIVSFEGVLWRNFTLTELLVPNGIIIGTGIFFFLTGLIIYHKRLSV
jgi:linearmycin/streptolysin S transport system permease protein